MKQNKIIATDNKHLKILIEKEVKIHGYNCNLNHINVSNVTDMSSLFYKSQFNGDLSQWDVSNVKDMNGLFYSSQFNGDISQWDVSNVIDMGFLFSQSQFNGDLSQWKPVSLKVNTGMFNGCSGTKPYWSLYDLAHGNDAMLKAIKTYHFFNQLDKEIANKDSSVKKVKI